MRCARCGGDAENIATPLDSGPVLVHAGLGACWDGAPHGFATDGRQPAVIVVDRGFQRLVDGLWVWPWE